MKLKHYLHYVAMCCGLLFSANVFAYNNMFIIDACTPTCWSGYYIGGQLGEVWTHTTWDYQNANYFNTLGPTILGYDFDFNKNGLIGGLDIGVNFQENAWVLGLEGSVLDGDFNKERTSPFFSTDRYTADVRWVSAAKIRFGYAYDRFLFSLTGGWAGGDLKLELLDPIDNVKTDSSAWASGWTAGASIDYMMMPSVSVGVAYDYIRLRANNVNLNCPACGSGIGLGAPVADGRVKTQSVMAHINYYFYH
jgi:outer membrane immunogenic protein